MKYPKDVMIYIKKILKKSNPINFVPILKLHMVVMILL